MKKVLGELFNRVNAFESLVPYWTRLLTYVPIQLTAKQKRLCNVFWKIFATNVAVENHTIRLPTMLHAMSVTERQAATAWYIMSRVAFLMQDKMGKRKSLFLYGPPSSGKSLLTSMLSSVVPEDLVGTFTMAGMRSTFWLQGLIHKCLYVGEEIILEEVSAQTLKLLCEGSRSNFTDVKFADQIKLEPRPTIVTANAPPYVNVSKEGPAFSERSIELRFLNGISVTVSPDRADQAAACAYMMAEAIRRFPLLQRGEDEDDTLVFV